MPAPRWLGPLPVGAVGFGAMTLSPGLYGTVDGDTAGRALRAALDAGATLVDTSDGYGRASHNEHLIGVSLGAGRDSAVISTKFGFCVPVGAERHGVELAYGTLGVNAEPQHVRPYALASLGRLQTDRIDLYSPHFPDPTVPIEETVGAMAELVAEGLVRHLGLSNVDAGQLERAVAVHPISAVHCEWSMWAAPDPELLAVADRHGVGVIAWAPLGAGLLGGELAQLAPDDLRNRFPRFAGSNLAVNNDRFAPVRALAQALGHSPSQLALAWLLHQHPAVVPIPGSTDPQHIAANVGAAAISLSPGDLAGIDEALRSCRPAGGTILGAGSGPRT